MNNPKKTALGSHHFDTGHNFNFKEIKILDKEDKTNEKD